MKFDPMISKFILWIFTILTLKAVLLIAVKKNDPARRINGLTVPAMAILIAILGNPFSPWKSVGDPESGYESVWQGYPQDHIDIALRFIPSLFATTVWALIVNHLANLWTGPPDPLL
jgi:hypothetical protein